eukprot:TRINITY_DN13004_c0_g1_i1.p1 TRINITY_DN13004_c0_g1~~TRINITY_DN13004_c0_g1_i1.p1  ORF type:complete len:265 (+),score=61.97 TRINITY_DN13004_c0_g1_i1:63-797(+)
MGPAVLAVIALLAALLVGAAAAALCSLRRACPRSSRPGPSPLYMASPRPADAEADPLQAAEAGSDHRLQSDGADTGSVCNTDADRDHSASLHRPPAAGPKPPLLRLQTSQPRSDGRISFATPPRPMESARSGRSKSSFRGFGSTVFDAMGYFGTPRFLQTPRDVTDGEEASQATVTPPVAARLVQQQPQPPVARVRRTSRSGSTGGPRSMTPPVRPGRSEHSDAEEVAAPARISSSTDGDEVVV